MASVSLTFSTVYSTNQYLASKIMINYIKLKDVKAPDLFKWHRRIFHISVAYIR